ncbi:MULTISPECIES: hypothetical protein [Providencia]|uniref:hypothetical protein n=1 Tax=Providencia TaxID=586 RepID=UPI001EF47C76|nr:hypothetical protein [Providencia rettgeri]CAB5567649.1 Uncharacterised protein [Providencia rettgeri]CAC9131258.1 Uncharacterised protein [Providencia rettgeri]
MTDKTGGAAFPVPAIELHGTHTGMTLRDYFAAKAMNAMISTIPLPWSLREQYEGDFYNTAQSAYKMADAMLKARG